MASSLVCETPPCLVVLCMLCSMLCVSYGNMYRAVGSDDMKIHSNHSHQLEVIEN